MVSLTNFDCFNVAMINIFKINDLYAVIFDIKRLSVNYGDFVIINQHIF